jgi:hypothetical protein
LADGARRRWSQARIGALTDDGGRRYVEIYRRSGFRVVDEADAPGGGPRIWFMRRDPRDSPRAADYGPRCG